MICNPGVSNSIREPNIAIRRHLNVVRRRQTAQFPDDLSVLANNQIVRPGGSDINLAIQIYQNPSEAPDTLRQIPNEAPIVAGHLIDRHPAVMRNGNVKTPVLVEIDIVGAALMVRAEVVE